MDPDGGGAWTPLTPAPGGPPPMSDQKNESCDLANQKCVPCRGGVPPLEPARSQELLGELGGGWTVVDNHHLYKEFSFEDFVSALTFTNRIGEIAEDEGHHPDLGLGWGYVNVKVYTHKIDGLTESDFYLAAKVEKARGKAAEG